MLNAVTNCSLRCVSIVSHISICLVQFEEHWEDLKTWKKLKGSIKTLKNEVKVYSTNELIYIGSQ